MKKLAHEKYKSVEILTANVHLMKKLAHDTISQLVNTISR